MMDNIHPYGAGHIEFEVPLRQPNGSVKDADGKTGAGSRSRGWVLGEWKVGLIGRAALALPS